MGLVYTSTLTLMSTTFDQLIAVTSATKAYVSNQTNDMGQINLCLDLTSICCTTLCFLGGVNFDKAVCQEEYPNCRTELVLEVIQVTLAYLIPMLAMIICYSLIIKTLLCARSLQKNKCIKNILCTCLYFYPDTLHFLQIDKNHRLEI